jgi:hypothetical protein
MVHRTDIAGWVGCSMGQVSSGDGRMCHPPNGAPIEKFHLPEPPPVFHFGGKTRCRFFVTAVPSVHAIGAEALRR